MVFSSIITALVALGCLPCVPVTRGIFGCVHHHNGGYTPNNWLLLNNSSVGSLYQIMVLFITVNTYIKV